MDDWSFALLSCKVVIKCFLSDSLIYKRGSESDFAYIIVGGAIKVQQFCFFRVTLCFYCVTVVRKCLRFEYTVFVYL